MTHWWTGLRKRKLGQWTLGYLAGAWIAYEVLSQVGENFAWPAVVMRLVTGANVDVYRDGGLVATVANNGTYGDKWENDGAASATHSVCEAGTSTCSSDATTNF